jgi:hypothetical protein
MADKLTVDLDVQDMKLLNRMLQTEFERLADAGRDMRGDPDVIYVGTWWRFVQEWLLEQGEL